ncbi:zinc finger, CCHC-type containing protein [Tanacetum coccineum]|uniref:Zinc finger, CCHC-type containing protein n=1 Tax=Tanacetum coccineum TaxID=301880 RepID=A0ABQ5CT73_9ASTR
MHLLLFSVSVVYVLTTPIPEDGGDDATVKQIRKRNKWDNDDYVCKCLILKGINNSSRYNDNKGKRKHHDNTKVDPNKKSKVTCWKCGKHGHLKKDCKGGKVGNKANGSGTNGSVDGSNNSLKDLHATPSMGNKKYFVTSIDDASRFCYVYLLHSKDEALDKFKVFKTEVELQQGSQIKRFRTDRGGLSQGFWGEAMAVVRLPDPKLKTLGERGIECIFVGYAKHSKAFRFYVIEPNDSVAINSIIESRDAIFDENRFSSVPRPSLSIPKGTEDIGGSVVPEVVTDEDDPKIFDEAIKSQDVAFWKEAINDEMDSIMGNNT